jgi:phytoene/squalene synthetase
MRENSDIRDRNIMWFSEVATFEALRVDLELCDTLVESAYRERADGSLNSAANARTKLERSYAMTRSASDLENAVHPQTTQTELIHLRLALDRLLL